MRLPSPVRRTILRALIPVTAVVLVAPAPAQAHGGCAAKAVKPTFDPGGSHIAVVRSRGSYTCERLHDRTRITIRLQSYEDGRWQTAAEASRTVTDGFVAGWHAEREYYSCLTRTYRTVAIGAADRRHRGRDVSAVLRVGCG